MEQGPAPPAVPQGGSHHGESSAVSASAPALVAEPPAAVVETPFTVEPVVAPPPVAEGADGVPQPFPPWSQVLEQMATVDRMLSSYMKGTSAYLSGSRVLIQGSSVFLTYMRENTYAREKIKTVIQQVSGNRYGIGPYEGPGMDGQGDAKPAYDATLQEWAAKGVDVTVE